MDKTTRQVTQTWLNIFLMVDLRKNRVITIRLIQLKIAESMRKRRTKNPSFPNGLGTLLILLDQVQFHLTINLEQIFQVKQEIRVTPFQIFQTSRQPQGRKYVSSSEHSTTRSQPKKQQTTIIETYNNRLQNPRRKLITKRSSKATGEMLIIS